MQLYFLARWSSSLSHVSGWDIQAQYAASLRSGSNQRCVKMNRDASHTPPPDSKMTGPTVYTYKARDAPVAVLLRRGGSRQVWRMIKWNLDTDIFTEGPPLVRMHIHPRHCSISPDGKYFAYAYQEHVPTLMSRAVVCSVSDFAPLYTCSCSKGPWSAAIDFDDAGTIVSNCILEKIGAN